MLTTRRVPSFQRRVCRAAVFAAVAGLAISAIAQTTIDGVQFIDRSASGEIPIGNYRGATAVLDYDRDGFMDLAVGDTNAQVPVRLFHNVPDPARPGRRTFADVSAGSGLADLDSINHRGGGSILSADYNNDGLPDLFMVAHNSQDNSSGLLFRNNGDGTFTNVSVPSGVRVLGERADSASFVDYDLDGWIDLFVAAGGTTPHPFRLYHNNRNGTFSDATALVQQVSGASVIYSHLWSDLDDDGWPDALILTSGAAPTLLHNGIDTVGNRNFIDTAAASGFTVLGPAPMGIAAGDIDGDGDLDIAITNAQVGVYYRNDGGYLAQITPFGTFFGWGVMWLDVDNDGRLDNYQAGSYPKAADFDRLHRNLGNGLWSDISPALNGLAVQSQYSVQVDIDNDGRQDIVTVNPGTPGQFVSVYENNSTTGNHWLKVSLVGDGVRTNRDAVGAIVRIHAGGAVQTREVIDGSSTTATEDLRQNFGVGGSAVIDWIEVRWARRGTIAQRTERYVGPFAADRIVTVSEYCSSDFDRDGFVTGDDFDQFILSFVTGEPIADFNADGFVTGDDFDAFVDVFVGGC